MAETNKLNIADHAREIAHAVFRISKLVEQPKLKEELEESAVELVAKAGEVPYVPFLPEGAKLPYLPYVDKLVNLIKLSEVVGEVKAINAQVISREAEKLRSEIAESIGKSEDIDLRTVFSTSNDIVAKVTSNTDFVKNEEKSVALDERKSKQYQPDRFVKPKALDSNQASNRQSSILNFIKLLPNGCRMKDMLERFPSVSERTIRNDLQTLISGNLIERFGAAQGPFAYYRAKGAVFTKDVINGVEPQSLNSESLSTQSN